MWTNRIWAIDEAGGSKVHFGPAEIAAWSAAERVSGRTHAIWYASLGVLVILAGFANLIWSSRRDERDANLN